MKTMMELLIRVQQLRDCCQRTANNPQLTQGEKNSARLFKLLVRECLPPEVLWNYDQLKQTDLELLKSPDIFAMAVLVDTYRNSTPAGRKKLLAHFPTPAPIMPHNPSPRTGGLHKAGNDRCRICSKRTAGSGKCVCR